MSTIKSLYYCFVDLHGADCNICQQEAFMASQSVKTIRAARGDWQHEPLPR